MEYVGGLTIHLFLQHLYVSKLRVDSDVFCVFTCARLCVQCSPWCCRGCEYLRGSFLCVAHSEQSYAARRSTVGCEHRKCSLQVHGVVVWPVAPAVGC